MITPALLTILCAITIFAAIATTIALRDIKEIQKTRDLFKRRIESFDEEFERYKTNIANSQYDSYEDTRHILISLSDLLVLSDGNAMSKYKEYFTQERTMIQDQFLAFSEFIEAELFRKEPLQHTTNEKNNA